MFLLKCLGKKSMKLVLIKKDKRSQYQNSLRMLRHYDHVCISVGLCYRNIQSHVSSNGPIKRVFIRSWKSIKPRKRLKCDHGNSNWNDFKFQRSYKRTYICINIYKGRTLYNNFVRFIKLLAKKILRKCMFALGIYNIYIW